jgi:hypothetical protein
MQRKATLLFLSSFIFAATFLMHFPLISKVKPSGPPTATANANAAKPQMPPGMSEEEMKMFSEFIDSLDQETIDALTAIGEEIIKEADDLGIDPFEYIELQAQVQKEFEEKAAKEKAPEKPKVEKPTGPTIPTSDALSAQETFNGIVKVIPVIIQKASSDITLSNELLPFKYRLDDMVFYFTKLADSKMLKYISDPEFAPLIEHAKKLYKDLITLNDQFYVAEFSLEGDNAYEVLDVSRLASQKEVVDAFEKLSKKTDPDMLELQLIREGKSDQQIKDQVSSAKKRFDDINNAYATIHAKEESKFILERILDAVAQAVDTNKILEESKKVLQKYEPDALKLKQEQEKQEAAARKTQDEYLKKRPVTSRSFGMPPPSGKYKKSGSRDKYSNYDSGDYSSSPAGSKSKDRTTSAFKPTKTSAGGKIGDKKKEDEKKEKKKKKAAAGDKKGKDDGKKAGDKGDKKDEKKGMSEDAAKALAGLKKDLKFIKRDIIRKSLSGNNEGIADFLTTAFAAAADPADVAANNKTKEAEKKPFIDLMVALTAKFNTITKNIKKVMDKLDDKKEEQNKFREEAAKLFKKFEESDPYKSILLLLKKNDQGPGYLLSDSLVQISKGTPPVVVNILADKRDALLKTLEPCEEDEAPEPTIQCLRRAFEKARETLFPKDLTAKK